MKTVYRTEDGLIWERKAEAIEHESKLAYEDEVRKTLMGFEDYMRDVVSDKQKDLPEMASGILISWLLDNNLTIVTKESLEK